VRGGETAKVNGIGGGEGDGLGVALAIALVGDGTGDGPGGDVDGDGATHPLAMTRHSPSNMIARSTQLRRTSTPGVALVDGWRDGKSRWATGT
jgi:hypothetical protein